MNATFKMLIVGSLLFVSSSCNKDDDNAPTTPTADYQPELKNL